MIKWIIVIILLVVALWAGDTYGRSIMNAKVDEAKAEAEQAHAAVDSIKLIEATLMERYASDTSTFHDILTRWKRIAAHASRIDTLPDAVDTIEVPIEVIVAVADSTIQACTTALQTCEQRVAIATERADSSASEASSYKEAVVRLEKLIKGPLIRPSIEFTTTTKWSPQAAFDLTLGRGHLKALGRVDVSEGAETCDFQPNVEAYSCSTPIEATVRLGARYTF